MVFVNNKKFACESCIKGHRSSACAHTDRPLFEIKKKGRPISQCEKCRSLRQSRKMHSKCNCPDKDAVKPEVLPLPASAGTNAKRFIPVTPSLPNGLKDLQTTSSAVITLPDARQRVGSLINSCSCKNPRKCKCRKSKSVSSIPEDSALAALATAAAAQEVPSRCCSPSSQPPPSKRPKHQHKELSTPLELPPLLISEDSLLPETPISVPDFDVMPPLSEITSLAGSGCTCGIECSCPGCAEHRGAENVDTSYRPCAHGCGTCVDNTHGIALPGHGSSSTSIIDRFFARAAALPAPPSNRKMGLGGQLDPMNVIVYPEAAIKTKEQGIPFGLITVPKLECCGGKCGCPGGKCGCGKSCDGCCTDHLAEQEKAESAAFEPPQAQAASSGSCCAPPVPIETPPLVRSCCSGKVSS